MGSIFPRFPAALVVRCRRRDEPREPCPRLDPLPDDARGTDGL